jgi:hypothetical protein
MKKILLHFIVLLCLTSEIAVAQKSKLAENYRSHVSRLEFWDQKDEDERRADSLDAINTSLKRFLLDNPMLLNEDLSILNGKGSIISTSEDKKVRIYCWDDRLGGTMRSANSVVQYLTGSRIKAERLCEQDSEGAFCPFYHDLHSVVTLNDTFYIVLSHFIASSGMGAYEIQAFKIVDDTLDWNVKAFETKNKILSSISYEYDVTSGGPNRTADHPIIKIDWPEKTFRIPLIDEKNRITGKYFVYSFNGQRFKFQRVE